MIITWLKKIRFKEYIYAIYNLKYQFSKWKLGLTIADFFFGCC